MPVTGNLPAPGNLVLPDVGELTYNGVEFDALYTSTLSGRPVPDAAGRTFKGVEYTLTVEGVVTILSEEKPNVGMEDRMDEIRTLLCQPGGVLIFEGKGLGSLSVNNPGGTMKDLAWGPKPTLLDFRPLGGSRAAIIRWQCTTLVLVDPTKRIGPLLQFNEEIAISYDEEGYSQLSIRGTMEIPLTRKSVNDRTLSETIDGQRQKFMDRVRDAFEPLIYRITQRTFTISRDRRTMEWQFTAVELPPMPPPPDCLVARGTFSVRPQKQTMALFPWICSLRASYVVRKDKPRRTAWWAFISMMRYRMEQAAEVKVPKVNDKSAKGQGNDNPPFAPKVSLIPLLFSFNWTTQLAKSVASQVPVGPSKKAFLIYFGVDEGLYLDSRTVSFEASWILLARFTEVFVATGMFRWPHDVQGNVPFSKSVKDISGSKSWVDNRILPRTDVIVDYNLGAP